jgi:hypothetical protein
MNQKEVWKDIKNYEGLYQVSNLGRVKSLKCGREKIMKDVDNGAGYYRLSLTKDGEQKPNSVHVLVAEAFLNHTSRGHKLVVNHIDFDRTNNNVDNLEIVTQRENANQKHMKSTSKYVGVTWNKPSKKWLARIRINGKLKHLGCFTDELEASLAYQEELKKVINNN